jgi:hypothetical protein
MRPVAVFHAVFERVFFTEFGVFGGLFRFTEFGVFAGLFRFTEFGFFAGLGLLFLFLAPKVLTTFLVVGVFRFAEFGVVAGEGGGAGGGAFLLDLAILLTHIFFYLTDFATNEIPPATTAFPLPKSAFDALTNTPGKNSLMSSVAFVSSALSVVFAIPQSAM